MNQLGSEIQFIREILNSEIENILNGDPSEIEQKIMSLSSKLKEPKLVAEILRILVANRRELNELKDSVKDFREKIESGTADVAVALSNNNGNLFVRNNSQIQRFPKLNDDIDINTGSFVAISDGFVIEKIEDEKVINSQITDCAMILEVYRDSQLAKVQINDTGNTQIVMLSDQLMKLDSLTPGTEVFISSRSNFAFSVVPKSVLEGVVIEDKKEIFLPYAEIGNIIELLNINFIQPICNYDKYKSFPLSALLVGPTGTGKTYSIIYSISRISKILGYQPYFVMLSPGDLRSSYFAGSEALINGAFLKAINHAQKGIPAIILINEADVLLEHRSDTHYSSVHDTLKAITSTFLANIDKLKLSHSDLPIALIMTSNFMDEFDASVTNAHRLQTIIEVDLPLPDEIEKIVNVHIDTNTPDREQVVQSVTDTLMDPTPFLRVYDESGKKEDIGLCSLVSPALIGGISKKAELLAKNKSFGEVPNIKHYEQATNELLQDMAYRFNNLTTAVESMPLRIRKKLKRICKAEVLYQPYSL